MKRIEIDELPLRCHRDIKRFFNSPNPHRKKPGDYEVFAYRGKSPKGATVWQIECVERKDVESAKNNPQYRAVCLWKTIVCKKKAVAAFNGRSHRLCQ
jgi:hypothetical protein